MSGILLNVGEAKADCDSSSNAPSGQLPLKRKLFQNLQDMFNLVRQQPLLCVGIGATSCHRVPSYRIRKVNPMKNQTSMLLRTPMLMSHTSSNAW